MHHSFKNQISKEIKSLFSSYPKFVFSKNNISSLDGIPVFVYHTIDPETFESHLLFLKENDYKTLSIHDFYNILTGKQSINNKSVLLTIDDARSSVWRYTYPLLEKYDMNCVVFIIPGITREASCRKNLSDVWNGRSDLKEINKIDENDMTLCNWQEISEMYKSGLVDIESHTLFHREIFKSFNITDFFIDEKPIIPYKFQASPYLKISDAGKDLKAEDYLGLPIFETAPVLLAGNKINISEEFMNFCRKTYKENTNINYDWKNEIKNFVNENSGNTNFFELQQTSYGDVLEDLNTARELIREKLNENAGNHLCLPWTIGNDDTIKAVKELGIKSCFWGVLKERKINNPGDDPFFISRIKNDFVFRLPGEGRKSFLSVYNSKFKRRVKKENVF